MTRLGALPWLAIGGAAMSGAVGLASFLRRHRSTSLDDWILSRVRREREGWQTSVARGIQQLASPAGMLLTTGFAEAVMKRPLDRLRVAAGGALRIGLETLCKHAFPRRRPPKRKQIGSRDGSSLPSGHALATAAYLTIANASGGGAKAIGVALFAGLLVSASRVYLAAHRPTDVAVGLLLAIGGACLVEGGVRALEAEAPRAAHASAFEG